MGIVTSKEKEKFDHFKKAQELREGLVSEFPSKPKYRENLATGHINTGLWVSGCRQITRKPNRIHQGTNAPGTTPWRISQISWAPSGPGPNVFENSDKSSGIGRRESSGNAIPKSLIHQENLVNLFPKNLEYRDELAITTNNLGILLAN